MPHPASREDPRVIVTTMPPLTTRGKPASRENSDIVKRGGEQTEKI